MERDDRAALERLRDILDAYGGDPERWPDAERRAALDLLARSAEARRLCDEALRLDAALDLLPAAQPVLIEGHTDAVGADAYNEQ
ncbi:hypothetical protein K2Z84_19135, partial [Candidatus Binatia bacterium]|nr:hypothetical protein [Candidatus Binatia bacterium]